MNNVGYLTANRTKDGDEFFTPPAAVICLLRYIELFIETNNLSEITIWCPFDNKNSEYVKIFSKKYNVIYSNIKEGKDFFLYEPEKYDIIISNPPFSIKDKILKRLHELNKPYAMLMPLPTLQGQKRFEYIKECQALIFDKRINFYEDEEKQKIKKGVAFASIYICKNFLPKDLIFQKL